MTKIQTLGASSRRMTGSFLQLQVRWNNRETRRRYPRLLTLRWILAYSISYHHQHPIGWWCQRRVFSGRDHLCDRSHQEDHTERKRQRHISERKGNIIATYHGRDQFCQFLLIDLSVVRNVVPSESSCLNVMKRYRSLHVECDSETIVEVTLACSRNSQEKFIEIDRAIVIRIERFKCKSKDAMRHLSLLLSFLLAEVVCFALRIELLVDLHELLLVQATVGAITEKTLEKPSFDEANAESHRVTDRMPFSDFYRKTTVNHRSNENLSLSLCLPRSE